MGNFNYEQYTAAVAAAQANQNNDGGNSVKIGYVKLSDDGDIAVARINVASTDELMFASVHQLNNVTLNGNRWPKVSCLNPLGMSGSCPLCEMAKAQGSNVGKASKKVYIPMLVSYRDAQSPTGFTAPVPAIWERPASFARELANKLMISGDLRSTLVLITRNGKKGDMQTTYSMDILPATHPVFKPDLIPNDFSAFNGFNIARHSYWEKSLEEINTFATTGSFPEAIRTNTQVPAQQTASYAVNPAMAGGYANPAQTVTPAAQTYTQPAPVNPMVNPQFVPAAAPQTPAADPATTATPAAAPARNFSGFSF